MNTLDPLLRQNLLAQPGVPLPIVDEQTKKVYYLISSEQYELVRALFAEEPFSPREAYPLIAKTAGEAGWNDPAMDEYDRYDELRRER